LHLFQTRDLPLRKTPPSKGKVSPKHGLVSPPRSAAPGCLERAWARSSIRGSHSDAGSRPDMVGTTPVELDAGPHRSEPRGQYHMVQNQQARTILHARKEDASLWFAATYRGRGEAVLQRRH